MANSDSTDELTGVSLREWSKSFGGSRVLDGVSLDVRVGEVHGLLGQNGSGKSTLIKILAGYYAPEPGATLQVGTRLVPLPLTPGSFRRLGLAFVHQDLALYPDLTVLENFHVGRLGTARGLRVPWRALQARAHEVFVRFGLGHFDLTAAVSSLGETDRALLAIVRAAEDVGAATAGTGCTGLLVLDEPTVFLPGESVHQLFKLIKEVAAQRVSVLFVSHNLDEVIRFTDRITVLRDGRKVGTVTTSQVCKNQLVELILGRRPAAFEQRPPVAPNRIASSAAVRVRGLSGGVLRDLSFDMPAGEVLGLTGTLGSGFEQVPYLLFGGRPARSGTLTLGDHTCELERLKPSAAVTVGLALVPGDRCEEGAVGELTVGENMTLRVLRDHRGPWGLRKGLLQDTAARLLGRFDVHPAEPGLAYNTLSGGNQQKTLLAKWLHTNPTLLLLYEPTHGVDVGARQQIFELLLESSRRGLAIVVASTDHEQLTCLCDRIIVLSHGLATAELRGPEITMDRLAQLTLGAELEGGGV